MKKLNLLLIPVLFSSLLAGCGMKGPLYRAPEKPKVEKQLATSENELTEQNKESLEGK